MALPEYGRAVQSMVDHALTIEDRQERQRCANTIIRIMISITTIDYGTIWPSCLILSSTWTILLK